MSELAWNTFPEVIEVGRERFGPRPAIVDPEAGPLTYAELADAVERAGRAFMAAGVRAGDSVGVWAPNIREWVVAALGLQSAGGVLVPMNTRYKGHEAGYILRKSRARILCTVVGFLDQDYVELLRGAEGGPEDGRPVGGLPELERIVVLRGDAPPATRSWGDFLKTADDVPLEDLRSRRAAIDPDEDLCDILFTSGTTGLPKGVMTGHFQALRSVAAWIDCVRLREGDRYQIVNPFFHVFGYRCGWLASLMVGATVYPEAVLDVPRVLRRAAEERITVLPGPPTLYQSILAHPDLGSFDLSSLRMGVTGAASIPVELVKRAKSELGFEDFVTGYGLTENCGTASMTTPDDDPEIIATTSGRAIPDVELRIVGPGGEALGPGEAGEVVLRGPNVMKGYLDDPEATAEAIDAEGWLHTGDVGVLDEAGNLRITDRLKDMLIVGGFNVYPAEVENTLSAHPKVMHAAVIGVPDERLGEVAHACLVLAPGETAEPAEILAWARERLAGFKLPRTLEFLDELPMNATGKVQKFVLRERAEAAL